MPASQTTPVIDAGPFTLRPPDSQDAAALLRACQDTSAVHWTNIPVPYFPETAAQWIREHTYDPVNAQAWWAHPTWSIVRTAPAHWIGIVEVRPLDHGAVDLALLIEPEHRQLGIATQAIRAVCEWSFDVLGAQVIRWSTPAGNDAAVALARRVGFTIHQDVQRLGFVQRGIRRDAITGDLLPSDIAENKPRRRNLGGPELTAREGEVLRWLARGAGNREIGNALQITENTVKNHVRSILEKLQAGTRLEAVMIGLQSGLISIPPATGTSPKGAGNR